MRKVTLISRINPKTGEIERPWRNEDGNYVLADPAIGPDRHTKAKAVLTPDYDEAVRLVREENHAIRMKGRGTPPSLISKPSLRFDDMETRVPVSVLFREAPADRKALHRELAQSLIAQAASIVLWSGREEAGEAFIGMPPENRFHPYQETDWQDIDLSRFDATRIFDIAYDYAFQVGDPYRFDEAVWTELEQLTESASPGTPNTSSPLARPERILTDDHDRGRIVPISAETVIRRVAYTAHARRVLDEPGFVQMGTRDLAFLANMDQPAVRNSLAKAGISAKGGIDIATAREWLKGRRGFVPTEYPV